MCSMSPFVWSNLEKSTRFLTHEGRTRLQSHLGDLGSFMHDLHHSPLTPNSRRHCKLFFAMSKAATRSPRLWRRYLQGIAVCWQSHLRKKSPKSPVSRIADRRSWPMAQRMENVIRGMYHGMCHYDKTGKKAYRRQISEFVFIISTSFE